jgi:hypothetical protein
MEDLLIALLQGGVELIGSLLEIAGQILWYGSNLFDLCDLVFRIISDLTGFFTDTWPGMNDDTRANWISFFYFLFGLATGAASLHFCHDVFLRKSASRLLALALGPFLSGCASWISAKIRLFLNATIRPDYAFWWTFFFSLGFSLVRFGFCHRPEM